MAAVVSRRVRTTPPAPGQALLIDWSNPITRDMTLVVSLADAGYGYMVGGQTVFPFTSGSQANTPQATGAKTGANPLFAVSAAGTVNSPNYSLFAVGSCTSNAVTQSALDMDNGTTRYFQFRLAAGKVDFIPFSTSAAVTGQATSPTALSVSEMSRGFTMGATASPARTAAFQNGVVTVGSTPSNLIAPGTNMPLNVGARQTNTQAWSTAGLSLVVTWTRTLTDAEMQSLADNPWQLFKPAPRRMWVPRAPLGAYVLQAVAAVFSLTGTTALMNAARRLVAGAGSFSVAGVPASLRVARRLPANPASFTLSGAAATIHAARRLPTQAGTFALSGSAAQMVYTPAQAPVGPTYTLGAAAGSFSLSGSPARLALARRLRAALGAFALTGAAARLQAARRLRADAGGFVIAGSAAVLKYRSSAGQLDVSQIPASRLVVFDGSGSRISSFDGSGSRIAVFGGSGARTNLNGVNVKLPTLVGTKMTVDRDPDEISHYGADITQELQDRATTAVSVDLVLVGVVAKEQAQIQVVPGDGGSRTYIVAFLAGTDSDPPDGWKWVARVTCANGERFDKTTWFNKVDP